MEVELAKPLPNPGSEPGPGVSDSLPVRQAPSEGR